MDKKALRELFEELLADFAKAAELVEFEWGHYDMANVTPVVEGYRARFEALFVADENEEVGHDSRVHD
jgi:hypothetical protein